MFVEDSILDIGTAKWSQKVAGFAGTLNDDIIATKQFMLPASDKV
jgi:hypothetical protein